MSWQKNKVFKNGSDFINWLDKNFGKYIGDHISELHVHHTWKPNHRMEREAYDFRFSKRRNESCFTNCFKR